MLQSVAHWYAAFCGVFLLLQGASTLAARWVPEVDKAVPALLETTRMVPAHSMLHVATALLALWALRAGAPACRWFAAGFGAFYLGLGVAGWATGRQLCLGLQSFDHPLHVLLGAMGLAAFALSPRLRRR